MQREVFFPTVDRCIASATEQGLLISVGWTVGVSIADAVQYAKNYRAGFQSPSAGFFDHEGKVILSHAAGKITLERAAALAIIELIEAAYAGHEDDREYQHMLRKVRDAYHGGEQSWSAQSTGEKLAAALALERPDWLQRMDYTAEEALDRIGPTWAALLERVAREVRADGHGAN